MYGMAPKIVYSTAHSLPTDNSVDSKVMRFQ